MAHINLSDVFTGENSNQNNQVGFFNLRNDGDEAIVRFMIDSVEDMEILTVHDIHLGGKYRQVSCIRDPRDPMEKCPLCERGERVKQVVFLKMLQYENTPNGIEVKPVVWQRSASTYAFRMKGYLDNYGPMSQILCKVIRHGAKGDMQTTYDIIPNLNPQQFPQEQYPIVAEAFDNYQALGRIILDKDYNEIDTFVKTGSFPEVSNSGVDISPQPQYITYSNNDVTQSLSQAPWEVNTQQFNNNESGINSQSMERPTRYY